jgi:hypothetical protein
MDIELLHKLASIISILLGLHLIRNYRKFGRETADSQRGKILPLKKATAKELSVCYLVGGIIFALVGVLSLLGVIRFKG